MVRKPYVILSIVAAILLVFALTAQLSDDQKRLSDMQPGTERQDASSSNTSSSKIAVPKHADQPVIVTVSALNAAVAQGNLTEVTSLVRNGADVNKTDAVDGRGPLFTAVADTHLEVAKFLISKGAAINAQDKLGMTPLHAAVLANQLAMVALLLDKKALTNIRDNDGFTPLDIAQRAGNSDIAALLR